MYTSLIKKIPLGSLRFYNDFRKEWSIYSHINRFNNKKFYVDNFILNHVLSGKNLSNYTRLFLSKHLDVYHFVFNMYNMFFKNNKEVQLRLYLPFILNSLNKYEIKDLFNIDLYPIEEMVRIISSLVVGRGFVYVSYYHIVEEQDYNFISEKSNFRDLVNHYYERYKKSLHKDIDSKDLRDVAFILENMYELIIESYLERYSLSDITALVNKLGFNKLSLALSIKIFLFYHSSNLVFYFKLYSTPIINRNLINANLEDTSIKFFITLDRNMYCYRSLYGQYEFGEIKDDRINTLKKELFKTKYFVKKRNSKIHVI